jgi:hypothetical protein
MKENFLVMVVKEQVKKLLRSRERGRKSYFSARNAKRSTSE